MVKKINLYQVLVSLYRSCVRVGARNKSSADFSWWYSVAPPTNTNGNVQYMDNCHIYEKYVSTLSLCRFKPSSKIFYWPFQCGASFVEHLCFVFLMISRLFIAALWSPAGKGQASWFLLVMFIVFIFFYCLMWYPGSGVVVDCIASWSLPSFLL